MPVWSPPRACAHTRELAQAAGGDGQCGSASGRRRGGAQRPRPFPPFLLRSRSRRAWSLPSPITFCSPHSRPLLPLASSSSSSLSLLGVWENVQLSFRKPSGPRDSLLQRIKNRSAASKRQLPGAAVPSPGGPVPGFLGHSVFSDLFILRKTAAVFDPMALARKIPFTPSNERIQFRKHLLNIEFR